MQTEKPAIQDETLVHITESAANKVASLIAEENNTALKLRIYIEGGGCSGFQYGFTFDEVSNEDDTAIEALSPATQQTVIFLIDAMSLQYLLGAEVDYKDDIEGERFIIRNPKAKTTCGCGSSFAVD